MRGHKITLSTLIEYLIYLYILILVITKSTGTTPVRIIRVVLMLSLVLYIYENKFVLSGYVKWAILFLIYNAIMVSFALYRSEALETTITLAYVLIINIGLFSYLKNHSILLRMTKVFIVSTIIKAVSTFGRFGILVFLTTRRTIEGSANTLGFYASIAFVLCLILQRVEVKNNKILYVVGEILCLLIALLTGSRKSIVYAFIPLIVYYILSSNNPLKSFRNAFFSGLGLVGLYLIIMKVPFIYKMLGSRIESMISGFLGNSTDDSTETRLRLIEVGMNWFKKRPWFGYGMGGYAALNWALRGSVYYSHNNYIELLVNCGIVGTIIYYMLYVMILRNTIKNKLIGKKALAIIIGIVVSLLIGDYGSVTYSFAIFQLILMCIMMVASGIVPYLPDKEESVPGI